jgi:hypothetical protein
MEHPIFFARQFAAPPVLASGAMRKRTTEVSPRSEVVETGPTCQAAECAGDCDERSQSEPPAPDQGWVTPSQIRTRSMTSVVVRRSTTSMPEVTVPKTV